MRHRMGPCGGWNSQRAQSLSSRIGASVKSLPRTPAARQYTFDAADGSGAFA